MDRYGLLGQGVGLSLSKKIHESAANILGFDISYEILEVKSEESLKSYLAELRSGIWKGFNVTTPYKTAVKQYLDHVRGKSINTIWCENEKLFGCSTDGIGFEKGLKHLQESGRKISKTKDFFRNGDSFKASLSHEFQLAFLGSGGAVFGILEYLKSIESDVLRKDVFFLVRNINSDSVKKIIEFSHINSVNISVHTSDIEFCMALNSSNPQINQSSMILINGIPSKTSIHWDVEKLFSALPKSIYFYDLTYAPLLSGFHASANSHFETTIDGLPMLVEQARQSQRIWWGKSPDYDDLFFKVSQER